MAGNFVHFLAEAEEIHYYFLLNTQSEKEANKSHSNFIHINFFNSTLFRKARKV